MSAPLLSKEGRQILDDLVDPPRKLRPKDMSWGEMHRWPVFLTEARHLD